MKVFDNHDAFVPIDVRVDSQKLFTSRTADACDNLIDQLLILIPGNPVFPPAFGKVRRKRGCHTEPITPDSQDGIRFCFTSGLFAFGRWCGQNDGGSRIFTRRCQHITVQRRRFRNPLQHRIHVNHHWHKVSQLQLTAAQSLRFLNKDGRQLIGICWIIKASARRAGNAFQNGHIVVVRKHGHGGNRHLIVDKLLQQLRRRRRRIAIRNDNHVTTGCV